MAQERALIAFISNELLTDSVPGPRKPLTPLAHWYPRHPFTDENTAVSVLVCIQRLATKCFK